MIELRFHGRGGQGGVTSSELTALAAIEDGKHAQAFPSFGPERRGAPIVAFVRVHDEPLRTREKIYYPDIVVVLDPTLMDIVDVAAGIEDDGLLVLNTRMSPAEVRRKLGVETRVAVVDATRIAMDIMHIPITNTTMLGALIKASGLFSLDALKGPIQKRFGPIAEPNFNACKRAYEETVVEG